MILVKKFFSSLLFIKNKSRKSVCLRSRSFSRTLEHLFFIKNAKFAFLKKGLVHRFPQTFVISSTFVFMQNRPRKCICGRSSSKRGFSVTRSDPCNPL